MQYRSYVIRRERKRDSSNVLIISKERKGIPLSSLSTSSCSVCRIHDAYRSNTRILSIAHRAYIQLGQDRNVFITDVHALHKAYTPS